MHFLIHWDPVYIDYLIVSTGNFLQKDIFKILNSQAFRFMVGLGHCPMISKYGRSLSKAVGPVDSSFFFMKKSHFNKKIFILQRVYELHKTESTCRLSTVKPVLSSHLKKKDKTKILITNSSLMKVQRIAECYYAILLTCIK